MPKEEVEELREERRKADKERRRVTEELQSCEEQRKALAASNEVIFFSFNLFITMFTPRPI